MPLAEIQSIWIKSLLKGECTLPNKSEMLSSIRKDQSEMRERYKASSRHTIQVDFYPYKRTIEEEMKKMKVRQKNFAF